MPHWVFQKLIDITGVQSKAVLSCGYLCSHLNRTRQHRFITSNEKYEQEYNISFSLGSGFGISKFYVRCRRQLCNSAEEDWATLSPFMASCRHTLPKVAVALRKRKTKKFVKGLCPSVCHTRFCDDNFIVRWIAKYREVLPPQFVVDDGVFAYEILTESVWCQITAFDARWCRFADQ
jgi:hypothetical protein